MYHFLLLSNHNVNQFKLKTQMLICTSKSHILYHRYNELSIYRLETMSGRTKILETRGKTNVYKTVINLQVGIPFLQQPCNCWKSLVGRQKSVVFLVPGSSISTWSHNMDLGRQPDHHSASAFCILCLHDSKPRVHSYLKQ